MLNRRSRTAASAAPASESLEHGPLEYLYQRFSTYIEDRRREPRDDVLTGLATATFPDGSTPEVIDVVRVAANVFSAGQETTVRLLGSALKVLAERPDIQELLRARTRPHPELHRGDAADREPGQGRLPAVAGADHGRRGRHPGRHHGDGDERRRQPRSAPVRGARRHSISTAQMPVITSRSAAASTPAPARRWPGPRRGCASSGCSTAPPTSGSRRTSTVPPTTGTTATCPTFILRGLTELHLEFTVAEDRPPMKVTVDDDRCRGHGVCLHHLPRGVHPDRRRLRGRAGGRGTRGTRGGGCRGRRKLPGAGHHGGMKSWAGLLHQRQREAVPALGSDRLDRGGVQPRVLAHHFEHVAHGAGLMVVGGRLQHPSHASDVVHHND